MPVFDVSDFSRDMAKIFDASLTNKVIINDKDGRSYKILPVSNGVKPLLEDVPYIKADITT